MYLVDLEKLERSLKVVVLERLVINLRFFLQGHYMTIHITPEADFSYVSFETNVPAETYKDLMQRVLEAFRPNEAVVTIFANKVRT